MLEHDCFGYLGAGVNGQQSFQFTQYFVRFSTVDFLETRYRPPIRAMDVVYTLGPGVNSYSLDYSTSKSNEFLRGTESGKAGKVRKPLTVSSAPIKAHPGTEHSEGGLDRWTGQLRLNRAQYPTLQMLQEIDRTRQAWNNKRTMDESM